MWRRPRPFWPVADQVVSSISNFVFVAAVARTASVDDFGAFALVYLVYGFILGAGRAVTGEILLLRASEAPERVRADGRRALGLQLLVGLFAAATIAAVSLAVEPRVAEPLRALAAVLPALLAQDLMRYFFFASGRPRLALGNDLVWAVVQIAAFALLLLGPFKASPSQFLIGWGVSAAVAAVAAVAIGRLTPRRPDGWVTKDFSRVGSFLADFSVMIGSFYVAVYLVGVVAGLGAVAGLRGAQILFAPFDALVAGFRIFLLPALGEAAGRGVAAIRHEARRIGAVLGALASLWGALVLLLPRSVGTGVIGDSWDGAEKLFPALAIVYVARSVATPALDGMRALGGGVRLVRLRSTSAALTLAGVVGGAALGKAGGAAIGFAVAFAASAVMWWLGFQRASRTLDVRVSEPPPEAAVLRSVGP